MIVRQMIPEGLAEMAPGPELAGTLAGIELPRLSGYDCVEVLKAQYRQVNHERARLMAAMAEVGMCGVVPATDELRRRPVADQFSADEVRAALVLTRRAAEAQFWLAHDLVTRLPAVHAAMDAGVLDEPRARVLSEWTIELSPEAARALCGELLPRAPGLTTGELIEQIKKRAIALDPEWAKRRYEQAIADRKVVGRRNADGSANLAGYNLPVDRVATACGHIDALAKAAKRAGDLRPIDHIRADLFLGMTDGSYAGLDDAAILARIRAVHQDGRCDQSYETADSVSPGDDRPGGGEYAAADDSASPRLVGMGMELRVRLSTLLGRDEYPGELAGWGPVHADLARELATTLGGATWRFAITGEQGQLLHCGITRARPTGTPARMAGCRAIIEIQASATGLRALDADHSGLSDWADVVADLAAQLEGDVPGEDRYAGDVHRRTPGAALRRYLETRDRSCVMIGCRVPARTADQDHTRDHDHGGPTTDDNLGAVCRHDHRLKHEGGWRLEQPQPGYFRWTSRLGHVYHRRPLRLLEPLPDPITRDQYPYPLVIPVDHNWEDSEIWTHPPPEPGPEPPSEPDSRDEGLPPF